MAVATATPFASLMVCSAGLLLAACSTPPGEPAVQRTPVGASTSPSPAVTANGSTALWSQSDRATRFVSAASPTSIDLPTLDIRASIVPVNVDDGVLEVPPSVSTVGWWRNGATPKDRQGTVVLDVHRDSRAEGRGPFAAAEALLPGDEAAVTDDEGVTHRYRVTDVTSYKKASLPYAELFRQDGPARMVLVTCGGTYDRSGGGWDSNVVVEFELVTT